MIGKILPPEVASHTERRMRFETEAKAIAALNHPNIVHYFYANRALRIGCKLSEYPGFPFIRS